VFDRDVLLLVIASVALVMSPPIIIALVTRWRSYRARREYYELTNVLIGPERRKGPRL
jgi:hypothetical protein